MVFVIYYNAKQTDEMIKHVKSVECNVNAFSAYNAFVDCGAKLVGKPPEESAPEGHIVNYTTVLPMLVNAWISGYWYRLDMKLGEENSFLRSSFGCSIGYAYVPGTYGGTCETRLYGYLQEVEMPGILASVSNVFTTRITSMELLTTTAPKSTTTSLTYTTTTAIVV